jgi:hypothetical protein
MTATIDQFVPATPVTSATHKDAKATPSTPEQQAERARKLAEKVARWKAIGEAGGSDAWVKAELTKKGLLVTQDPAKLKDSEKGAFKEKKKAEAAERRTLKRLAWEAFQATHIVHLGAGVHWDESRDVDALDAKDRPERLRANGLPELETPEALATALGLPLPKLRWFAFHREVDTGTHYHSWQIPKRDGSMRTITAPKRELKAAQRWALRNVFERLPVHSAAHGFLAARSIATNAAAHAGADVVVKLDIKDFFPTITWKRVKGLLRKAGLPEQTATLLSLMATESPREQVSFRQKTLHVATGPRALPQGAPTSPAITNALCVRLDRRMSGLGRKLGFVYTRYADDLAFSWRSQKAGDKAPIATLILRAGQILAGEGFVVHPKKTRILRKGNRQRITGLVVNSAPGQAKARVPRETIRNLRAALHHREHGKPSKGTETLAQLRGMAAFIHMSDPKKGAAFLERIAKLEASQPAPSDAKP